MKDVSVVMPSYNRAHLLPLTVPTYLQEDVRELIIIDDCSTDDTRNVVAKLRSEYPQIVYVRNERNSKQTFSKNVGIGLAKGEYIYFGDDDSILLPNSIRYLKEILTKVKWGGVMARPLFAGPDFKWDKREQYIRWRLKRDKVSDVSEIYDVANLRFDWERWTTCPVEVPTCHACALVNKELATQCLFDTNYHGCAYREETDFFFRLSLDYGAKLLYDARACQLNLPVYMVKQTGARSGGSKVWRESAIECNRYFLEKNWSKIARRYGINKSVEEMQRQFEMSLPTEEKQESKIKLLLKQIYFRLIVYTL